MITLQQTPKQDMWSTHGALHQKYTQTRFQKDNVFFFFADNAMGCFYAIFVFSNARSVVNQTAFFILPKNEVIIFLRTCVSCIFD